MANGKKAARKAAKKATAKNMSAARPAAKNAAKKAVEKSAAKRAGKKAVAKRSSAKKATAKTQARRVGTAKKSAPNAAFMRPLTPDAALAAVVGPAPLPRTEIVSKLWAYIKKNKLQDSVNKRMVNADAKLRGLFGKAQLSMFELAGAIGRHVGDPDPDDTNDPGPYIGRRKWAN